MADARRDGAPTVTSAPQPRQRPDASMTYVISETRVSSADPFLFHKTTRRELYDGEWKHYNETLGADEVLYLNERGELAEGSRTTIFIERDGRLLIRSPRGCCPARCAPNSGDGPRARGGTDADGPRRSGRRLPRQLRPRAAACRAAAALRRRDCRRAGVSLNNAHAFRPPCLLLVGARATLAERGPAGPMRRVAAPWKAGRRS